MQHKQAQATTTANKSTESDHGRLFSTLEIPDSKKEYLQDVISFAAMKFTPGENKNKEVKDSNPDMSQYRADRKRDNYYSRITDPQTPILTAISENIFATESPRNGKEVLEQMDAYLKYNIQKVVVLISSVVDGLNREDYSKYDSHDYIFSDTASEDNSINIKSSPEIITGNISAAKNPLKRAIELEESSVVNCNLSVNRNNEVQAVTAHVFAVIDDAPLIIKSDKARQQIWNIHQYIKDNKIAVHCCYGVGRTGAFILMLEILRNYDLLFNSGKTVVVAASGIIDIVTTMRQNRPGLIWNHKQFRTAITNAIDVYQYALRKAYVQHTDNDKAAKPAASPSLNARQSFHQSL